MGIDQGLQRSRSYRLVKFIATVMDIYCLDPVIGLLFPGIGDVISALSALPCLYVCIFRIRALPLTLAVISNMLLDLLVGLIPWVGEIFDVFFRSNLRNFKLITGYVEGDETVIRLVRRRAKWMVAVIVITTVLIVLMFSLVVSTGAYIVNSVF